jgi:alpha-maltose-1-phosphate synthase
MTRFLARQLGLEDQQQPFFQIGAMFDMPSLAAGKVPCYSYHDGCLAERVNSPLPMLAVPAKLIDRALEYERRVHTATTHVFTFSDYLRNSFIQNYGLPANRVTTLGAGLNMDTVPDPNSTKRYDTQEILFIGADFTRKGGEQLLRAFSVVRQKQPKATLNIVGPRELAIPDALSSGVVFHGFLNRNDADQSRRLDELFRRASLFVMPSLYEPFGIAPLEAMCYELPCVLTNGWALAEMVVPGVTGTLVEPKNEDALATAICALLDDPSRLAEMGRVARSRVVAEHSWEKVVDRLIRFLDTKAEQKAT